MSKASEVASTFISECTALGWSYSVMGSVVRISKNIEPDNLSSFSKADSEYSGILSIIPTTAPGSVWGTDGGGVGALSAVKSGTFKMNKSGCSKRVCDMIHKLSE